MKSKIEHLDDIREMLSVEWSKEFTTLYRNNREQGFPKKNFELENEKMVDLWAKIFLIDDLKVEIMHKECFVTPDEEEE